MNLSLTRELPARYNDLEEKVHYKSSAARTQALSSEIESSAVY
jgi:hypothetical protein